WAAEHFARGGPADTVGSLVEALAQTPEPVAAPIIAGLARGWPKDRPPALSEPTEKALVGLLSRLSPTTGSSLVTLAARWNGRSPWARSSAGPTGRGPC